MVPLKPPLRKKALITQSLLAFLGCVNYRFTAHAAEHIVQLIAAYSRAGRQPGPPRC